MKMPKLTVAASLLTASLAPAAFADGVDPAPADRSTYGTLLVMCQKGSYPSGMYCNSPEQLGGVWYRGDLHDYLTYDIGCTSPSDRSVYNCTQYGFNGVAMVWAFNNSDEVSTIVYTLWPVGQ